MLRTGVNSWKYIENFSLRVLSLKVLTLSTYPEMPLECQDLHDSYIIILSIYRLKTFYDRGCSPAMSLQEVIDWIHCMPLNTWGLLCSLWNVLCLCCKTIPTWTLSLDENVVVLVSCRLGYIWQNKKWNLLLGMSYQYYLCSNFTLAFLKNSWKIEGAQWILESNM